MGTRSGAQTVTFTCRGSLRCHPCGFAGRRNGGEFCNEGHHHR
jgi:hypothetical protein